LKILPPGAILGEENPASKDYVIGVTVPVMKSAVGVMNGRSIALPASPG
jgi:hypothetical protein